MSFARAWKRGFETLGLIGLLAVIGMVAGACLGGMVVMILSLFSKPASESYASLILGMAGLITVPWVVGEGTARIFVIRDPTDPAK